MFNELAMASERDTPIIRDHSDRVPTRVLGRRAVRQFAESVCAFAGTVPPSLVSLDAAEVAASESDLEARLIATPVNKDHQDEIVGDLLAAVQS